jgi:hypothetical protein
MKKIKIETIKTMDKVYWDAYNKYKKGQTEFESHLKPIFNGRQIRFETNILLISSLDAFNQLPATQ